MFLKAPTRYVRTPILGTNPVTGDPTVTKKLVHAEESENPSAVSVENEQFKAKDGIVEVPDRLAPRLMKEGWIQVAAPAGAQAQKEPPAGSGAQGSGSGQPAGTGTGAAGGGSGASGGGNRGGSNRSGG